MRRDKPEYLPTRVSYDIESTSMREGITDRKIAFAYTHALCVEGKVYVLRTYEQLAEALGTLLEWLGGSISQRLVVYVHNLGFEFGHMKAFFEWQEVFAIGDNEHNVVRACTTDGVEFRCSLALTNKPLKYVGADVGVQKMTGDLDYGLVRHHGTRITAEEAGYIRNDVLIIDELIRQRTSGDDDLSTIPMTKTGYVRRRVRKAVRADAFSRNQVRGLKMTTDDYLMARQCFSGGYTHASARFSGLVVTDVDPYDLASAYPRQIVSQRFPMTSFFDLDPEDVLPNMGELAMMLDVTLVGVECRYDFPAISRSKCDELDPMAVIDNGRVYYAKSLRVTVTDVELATIRRNYDIQEVWVNRAKAAVYDHLPEAVVRSVLELYVDKTTLKGVKGQEVRYKAAKEDLNSVYGMMGTDPVRVEWDHIGGGELVALPVDVDAAIRDHNASRGRFLFYPWGAWVTAHTRSELLNTIMDLTDAGVDVLYCDTDSTYSKSHPAVSGVIAAVNERTLAANAAAAEVMNIDPALFAPVDPEGVAHPIGLFEQDNHGDLIDEFKTLGAKRYATVKNGEFSITVAGLNKGSGAEYVEAHGGMAFFEDGMTIPAESSGRLVHTYSDELVDVLVTDYEGVEARVTQTGFVHLEAAPYTLSIGDEYRAFMQMKQLDTK